MQENVYERTTATRVLITFGVHLKHSLTQWVRFTLRGIDCGICSLNKYWTSIVRGNLPKRTAPSHRESHRGFQRRPSPNQVRDR